MSNNGLVSVVVTTYKRHPSMVKKAVDSILSQTYTNIELFVVDDSPKDFIDRENVKNMIKSINDDRVNYIAHEINQGACVARNTGIKASRGEYIAFLDDDDEWYATKLEKQIGKIEETNCDFVYCRKIIHDKIKNKDKRETNAIYRGDIFEKLLWDNFIGPTSVALIKRSCFDKVGMFDTDLLSSQDYEMWLRIAKEFKIDYVDEELLHYYIHEGDRISSNSYKKIQGIKKLNSIYSEYLENNKDLKAHRTSILTLQYAMDKDIKNAMKVYFEAFKISPLFMISRVKFNAKCIKRIIESYSERN